MMRQIIVLCTLIGLLSAVPTNQLWTCGSHEKGVLGIGSQGTNDFPFPQLVSSLFNADLSPQPGLLLAGNDNAGAVVDNSGTNQ